MHANKRTGYDKTVRNPRPRTLKRKNQTDDALMVEAYSPTYGVREMERVIDQRGRC